jgi:radical SAM superfamily enzyme YgiQ (UPF0313 family)
MILNCTPPYRHDFPNPALGYLKGFLQAKGIPVKNVYWNVELFNEMMNYENRIRNRHPIFLKLPPYHTLTFYVGKHLLTENPGPPTLLDIFFSSLLSKEEISLLLTSVKKKIDEVLHKYNFHKTDLTGFTLKSQQWLMSLYIITRLKEINPDVTVVLGGITSKEQARTFLNLFSSADFAIWGEGEYPLYSLVTALKNGTGFEEVPQLVYRKETIFSTTAMDEFHPLDEYPFADHSDYFEALTQSIHGARVQVPIWGSRGCPWNKCKFCVDNEEYSYRTRSPESIVQEIKYQSQKYGINVFAFVDSELPGNKKRFLALLKSLVRLSASRSEPYSFFGEVSPIFIDNKTAQLMRLASFTAIQMGFEAMTDSLLEKMQKRQRFAHNIQALKLGRQYHLKMGGLNILRGIPPEKEEDIIESCINIKFLRFLLNTFILNPTPFILYKGSSFYHEMSEKERETWNYNEFWKEISPTIIPEEDRFDFFGFCRERCHHKLWDQFEIAMSFYKQQNCSYTWFEYENGSFIEEKGQKTYQYRLDRDETDILVFCDSVRSLSEVQSAFLHLHELQSILYHLKEAGLLYYDKDMHTIVSVLEACRRKSAK